MSQKESKVELAIDAKYSSGDSSMLSQHSTEEKLCKEENNNDIDELSEKVGEMGCIMDGVKRPPNICVETCVYESDSEDSGSNEEEVNYSDEFEEDKSDKEEDDVNLKLNVKEAQSDTEEKLTKLNIKNLSPAESTVKLSKSQSFMSSKASVSGKSSIFGSTASSSRTRRVNMSFSNDRLREIERQNHLLLNKIMTARNIRKSTIPPPAEPEPRRRIPHAAMLRKKEQQKIDHENMILLKKLQRAKSSAYSIRR